MKLPVVRTLESALSPLNKLNWALGMGVIQYPDGKPHRIISACWTIIQLIIFLTLFQVTNVSTIEMVGGSVLVAQCYQVTIYTLAIAYIACLCAAKLNATALCCCARNMDAVNGTMRIFGIPDDYDVTFKSLCFQTIFAAIFGTILMGIDFAFVDYNFPTETQRITYLLSIHLMFAVAFVADWTFNVWIRYIGKRFQRLNSFLVQFDENQATNESVIGSSDDAGHRVSNYSTMTFEIHGSPRQVEATNKQWMMHAVRKTRNVHRDLCAIAREVNKAFAITLLLCTTTTFISVTSLLLSDYISLMALNAQRDVTDVMITVATIIWTIANAVRVLIAVRTCSKTSDQAQNTGKIIHNLRFSTTNTEIHNEIRVFSLQLIQNPLYFTACDLFILDYKLIGAMVDTVVTFLVIMIQMLPPQDFGGESTDLKISTSPTASETISMNSAISLDTE